MGYFKRFGDFCSAFGAFSAVMYVFRQYMETDFGELEALTEKLKYFFSNEPRRDYRFYLPLIALFLLSFALSTALHKYPHLTLAVSVLPMIQLITMFRADKLYERPMLYVVLSSVHIIGCLFECIRRDREDRHRRAALATDLLGLCVIGFCAYIMLTVKKADGIDFSKANIFQSQIYLALPLSAADTDIFKYTAICFGALVLLRLLLRDLYYLDAILGLAPFIATVYLWNSGKITLFGAALTALTLIYAVSRVSVMLLCKPKPHRVPEKSPKTQV